MTGARPARRRTVSPVQMPDPAEQLALDVLETARGDLDRRLLRALSDSPDLTDCEQDAFDEMLERLAKGQRRELTERQREWAERVADRVGVSVVDPAERNANVPRGRDVPSPDVLSPEALKKALAARRVLR